MRDYAGKKVGIDALCWMHQGAYQYAKDLINSSTYKGFCKYNNIDKIINYCMSKVRML